MSAGESAVQSGSDFFELEIWDAQQRHIVTLKLKRQEGMTNGDLMQLQNYLWTTIGMAIRDSKELQHRLALAGIETVLEKDKPTLAPEPPDDEDDPGPW